MDSELPRSLIFHFLKRRFLKIVYRLSHFLRVMINWRQNAGGPSARIEEVIRALRRMGVNPVAGALIVCPTLHISS